MKQSLTRISVQVGGLIFTLMVGQACAQNLLYSSWDTDVQGWTCGGWDDSGVSHTVSWDGSLDAQSNALSGALRIEGSYTNGGAYHIQTCQAVADFTSYNAISLDVYVAPGEPLSPNGDYGLLDARLRTGSWEWPGVVVQFGPITNTGWTHLEAPIPIGSASSFSGVNLELNTSYTDAPATHSVWVDNFTFIAPGVFHYYSTWGSDVQGWSCGGWDDSGVTHSIAWDGSLDVSNNPASGSLRIDAAFTTGNALHLQNCTALSDFSPYQALGLDVYVAPGSALTPNGDFGSLAVRLRTGNWSFPGTVIQFGVVTNEGWSHLQADIPPSADTNFAGVNLEWTTSYTNSPTIHSIWVDNLVFIGLPVAAPPPSLTLEKAGPGVELVTCGTYLYGRKNIATAAGLAPVEPWTTSLGPVTYSMTVNQNVQPAAPGFALNIMLIGTGNSTTGNSPDWDEANGIFLEARPNTAGSVDISVRYKTNAPASHGERFNPPGLIAGITNAPLSSLVGTWSLILSNEAVAFTGPGGVNASGSLPSDVPALFSPNVFALFGVQPYGNLNRSISLSRIQISGGSGFGGGVDQDFTTASELDPSYFEKKQEDPDGIHLKPTNTVYRVSWTLPDTGFNLFSSAGLAGPWSQVSLVPVAIGDRRVDYISNTNVSGPHYFFRLQK